MADFVSAFIRIRMSISDWPNLCVYLSFVFITEIHSIKYERIYIKRF